MPFIKPLPKKEFYSNVSSIVLAGGQGSRLYPLTQSRCKPAVSFGGRYRLIDIPISNSLNSRINKIYVISQYFSSFLHQHIMETYPIDHTRETKIHLLSPEETFQQKVWYHGTADAIRQNLDHFKQSSVDYFLILSGDQLYNIDFCDMLEFAKESNADLVIAALAVEEAEAKRMGLLKIDAEARVQEFIEKPSDPHILKSYQLTGTFKTPQYLGSMGIYVFKREALFQLLNEKGDDFGKHLIPQQIKKGSTSAYIYKGYWEDIGTVKSFFEANLALTRKGNCLNMYDEARPICTHPHNLPSPFIKDALVRNSHISQGAIIEAKAIFDSIIGLRTHIKKGTTIQNSVILGNLAYLPPAPQSSTSPSDFSIGENCTLDKVIVDEHTQIGNNVQLINKERLQNYDGNGIFIRDGIIIVTTGTKVPDNFVL